MKFLGFSSFHLVRSVVASALLLLPLLAEAGQLNAQVSESDNQSTPNYLTLTAPAGTVFTSVDYANYGVSVDNGDGTYTKGSCQASNSQSIVESAALNKNTFSIEVSDATFGDPCFGTRKSLAVVVTYATPLPVVLTSFTVAAQPGSAGTTLTWATASEVNSARFEVQRSSTGSSFTALGSVAAHGSSSVSHTYTWLDASLPAGATTLYYRLRQVDVDGSSTYSPVRSVRLERTAGLALYPNPGQAATTLGGAASYAPVRIFTPLGGLVAATTADATGTALLTLPSTLPTGVYVVRAGTQTVRLLVK